MSLFEKLQPKLEDLNSRVNIGRELEYSESLHAWDILQRICYTIQNEYQEHGYDEGFDDGVIQVLNQLEAYGGKLNGKAKDVFNYYVRPWFKVELSKAKGLQDTQSLEALSQRYTRFMQEVKIDESLGDYVDKISHNPINQVNDYMSEHDALRIKVLNLIVGIGKGDQLQYDENGLRTQKEKDVYTILFYSISQLPLDELQEAFDDVIATYDSGGPYMAPFFMGPVLEPALENQSTSKAMWKVLYP